MWFLRSRVLALHLFDIAITELSFDNDVERETHNNFIVGGGTSSLVVADRLTEDNHGEHAYVFHRKSLLKHAQRLCS